jgi:pyruvate dehydrogenase E2 component (dihydrolipoamide acetyltransferase)
MEEGTFSGWLRQDGERIKPGDALFLLEGDKSTEEIQAVDEGILRIPPDGPKPGDTVRVGQVLAQLVLEGESVPQQGTATSEQPSVAAASITPRSRKKKAITPRARRVARELGIEWSQLEGSGRNGRIRERDIRTDAGSRLAGKLIPHTTIRRTIATRMVAGVTQAAPVTLTTKVNATNLVALRQQFKASTGCGEDFVPSYNDILMKLTAAALRQHSRLQVQWREEGLFLPEQMDIAFAVDTDAGLLVPVLRRVDQLSLRQIADQSRELIVKAKEGRLSAAEMRDATFTISNLGSFGIDAFTPILHLPQCAVLGIGRIRREPAMLEDRIVDCPMLTLSLTFDHRSVDGAKAARFLQTLARSVENRAPSLIS